MKDWEGGGPLNAILFFSDSQYEFGLEAFETQPSSWQMCDRRRAKLILLPVSVGLLLGLFIEREGSFLSLKHRARSELHSVTSRRICFLRGDLVLPVSSFPNVSDPFVNCLKFL